MTERPNDYEVGYGKPPKDTRFKKGESGNKKGRPKGARNFRKDLHDILSATVAVTDRGRSKKVSSQLATLMRLREKALQGDPRALDRLISLMQEHDADEEARASERGLSGSEAEILDRFFEDRVNSSASTKHSEECGGQDDDGAS